MKQLTIILLCLLTLANSISLAQQTDTSAVNTQFIEEQLENISSTIDQSVDFSDLTEQYYYYFQHKISINSQEITKLEELYLLNTKQVSDIRKYKNNYGNIMSEAELLAVQSLSENDINRILPFITFKEIKTNKKRNLKYSFKYPKQSLIFRYSRIMEKSSAYLLAKDSAINHPSSVYLGSPDKLYLRYSLSFSQGIRAGFTLEKDAGEKMFYGNLPDSIKSAIPKAGFTPFDFSSAFVYAEKIGFVNKIILGDYHLQFGQGLTIWSGLSFGKSSEAVLTKKYGVGIKPNTSTNENIFFRGGAATLNFAKFYFTGFYSQNKIDASIDTIQNGNSIVKSLTETGLHRTINEMTKRKALVLSTYGGHISFKSKYLGLGLSAINTKTKLEFSPDNNLYKKYSQAKNNNTNFGFDFDFHYSDVNIFGEYAQNDGGGFALLSGINYFAGNRLTLSALYRNYSKSYFNFFSNGFGEYSSSNNEEGIYLGIKILLLPGIDISAYSDFFRCEWLKYGISFPSQGRENLIQLNYTVSRNFQLNFRYKNESKQENYKGDYDYLDRKADIKRNSFRISMRYSLNTILVLTSRMEYLQCSKTDGIYNGYLFYQDVKISPTPKLSANARLAFFDTDDWESRIYAYESDVLYAFSVPAYYEKGFRYYFNLRYKAGKHLQLWLRYARTVFSDKYSVGSGADLINGNHKSEFKVQLKLKL